MHEIQMGKIIRKCRREKKLTQEELAGFLGVTAPAVNKWENGNSCPDIALLVPLARLLGISTDRLLSYREEPEQAEQDRLLSQLSAKLKQEEFSAVFGWAMEIIREYPNCGSLILDIARTLDSFREFAGVRESQSYDAPILQLYQRLLKDESPQVARAAREALFYHRLKRGEYEQAQQILDGFPARDGDFKKMQAVLHLRQGRRPLAYRANEEMLFSSYRDMTWALQNLCALALEDGDRSLARRTVEMCASLARQLELGDYLSVSPGLNLAVYEKDREQCLDLLERMVHGIRGMASFGKSPLLRHMEFSEMKDFSNIAFMLKKGLEGDESIDFLRQDPRFQALLKQLDHQAEAASGATAGPVSGAARGTQEDEQAARQM